MPIPAETFAIVLRAWSMKEEKMYRKTEDIMAMQLYKIPEIRYMQWIGQFDDSGNRVAIFQSDIVDIEAVTTMGLSVRTTAVVIFNTTCSQYQYQPLIQPAPEIVEIHKVIVKGNRYENPELLTPRQN